MAKDSIASLNIALRATADKLSSDINRGMKGAEKSLGASATKLGVAMGLGIVAGIGTAMVGLGKVISMAFEGLDRIDALDEAASKIGLTYNAMQDLKLAAVTTGASFEGMTNAIAKMQGNLSNGSAAEALQKHAPDVHAVTDVTGYGLAGHGWEIAERSNVTLVIETSQIPLYPGALAIAESGHRTGGDIRNRQYVGDHATFTADESRVALCMDPQTSGGLLAAVTSSVAETLVATGEWTAVGSFITGGPSIVLQ